MRVLCCAGVLCWLACRHALRYLQRRSCPRPTCCPPTLGLSTPNTCVRGGKKGGKGGKAAATAAAAAAPSQNAGPRRPNYKEPSDDDLDFLSEDSDPEVLPGGLHGGACPSVPGAPSAWCTFSSSRRPGCAHALPALAGSTLPPPQLPVLAPPGGSRSRRSSSRSSGRRSTPATSCGCCSTRGPGSRRRRRRTALQRAWRRRAKPGRGWRSMRRSWGSWRARQQTWQAACSILRCEGRTVEGVEGKGFPARYPGQLLACAGMRRRAGTRVPACLLACLLACLPARLPACPPACAATGECHPTCHAATLSSIRPPCRMAAPPAQMRKQWRGCQPCWPPQRRS